MSNSFILIIALLCSNNYLSSNKYPAIDSIEVYCLFKQKGYTTAGARNQFDVFKRSNIQTKRVDIRDCKRVETILESAVKKRHYQRKFGMHNLFLECYVKDEIIKRNCILGIGEHVCILTDLTQCVEYHITEADDIRYIEDLLKRLREMCD
jgi:hypothetical protein